MTNSEKFKVYLAYRCYLISWFERFCKSVLEDVSHDECSLEDGLRECSEKARLETFSFHFYLKFCVADGLFTTDASVEELVNFDKTINMYLKAVKDGRLGGITIYGK